LVRDVCTKPGVEILKLLDAAIFQVLVGNADAHGKNYSLLHRDDGIILAPLYDLLCTVAYPDLSPTFAMKIARRGTLADLKPGDWDSFAKEAGLTSPFVRRRVTELADAALECWTQVVEELAKSPASKRALRGFGDHIKQRAERLSNTI
jgi:serine/threonine-protein kinase HipA